MALMNEHGEFVDDFDAYAPMALRKGGARRDPAQRASGIRRTCPMCQRNFWADGTDDRYCSARCRRAATGGVRQLADGTYEGGVRRVRRDVEGEKPEKDVLLDEMQEQGEQGEAMSEVRKDEEYWELKAFAELAWTELKAIGRDGVFLYDLLEERAEKCGLETGR